jgi:hypothetical protein
MVVFLLDFNFAAFSWWSTKHEKAVLKSQTEDETGSEQRMTLRRKDSLDMVRTSNDTSSKRFFRLIRMSKDIKVGFLHTLPILT